MGPLGSALGPLLAMLGNQIWGGDLNLVQRDQYKCLNPCSVFLVHIHILKILFGGKVVVWGPSPVVRRLIPDSVLRVHAWCLVIRRPFVGVNGVSCLQGKIP